MECLKCGIENSEAAEFCTKCGSHVAETQQMAMRPSVKGDNNHVLGAIPGIALLFIAGPAYVYHFRLHGQNPSSIEWFLATTMTSCAIALLGAMVFRYQMIPSAKTRSLVAVAFISASSVCFVVLGLILAYWSRLDLRYEYEPLLFAFSAMIAGVGQSAVAAIESDRLEGNRGVWRILSMAIAIPAYVLAVYLVVASLTVSFGTS